MGCVSAKNAKPKTTAILPTYMTPDPDLGWRNISHSRDSYPLHGFLLDFQNERSGNILKRINLVNLSINVAERASKLANRYGVTAQAALHSSTNLLEDLALQKEATNPPLDLTSSHYIRADMKKILRHFECPDYGWKLLERARPIGEYISHSPQIFFIEDPPSHEDMNGGEGRESLLKDLASKAEYMQVFHDGQGVRELLLDVSEVAVNIAEQLFRLEKAETVGHRVPDVTFGWKGLAIPDTELPSLAVPVSEPEGEALMLIPEELIMHVASWVQQTYLTAPVL